MNDHQIPNCRTVASVQHATNRSATPTPANLRRGWVRPRWFPTALLVGGFALLQGWAADLATLDEHLEPLRPFLGKTWKGHFQQSAPDKPMIDVSRWERALNGRAVRVLHSVNNGAYGGETLILWDQKRQSLAFYYFTTAGFHTTGTMQLQAGTFVSHEVVSGSAEGVTEVKATGSLRPDGVFVTKSEYLKGGKWVPGHEITYREDPQAEVVFK